MKQQKIRLRLIIIFVISLAIIGICSYKLYFVFKNFLQDSFVSQSIALNFKHIYSGEHHNRLEHFVQSEVAMIKYSDFDPIKFYTNLKQNFKFVKKTFWNRDDLNSCSLTIEGVVPVFRINKKFILGNKRRLFLQEIFSDFDLNSLRQVDINPSLCLPKLPIQVWKFLKKIPNSYWDRYTVTYLKSCNIFLDRNSKDQMYRFIVNEDLLFNEKNMELAGMLYKDFVDKKGLLRYRKKSTQNKRLVYDMRFRNCVCVKMASG